MRQPFWFGLLWIALPWVGHWGSRSAHPSMMFYSLWFSLILPSLLPLPVYQGFPWPFGGFGLGVKGLWFNPPFFIFPSRIPSLSMKSLSLIQHWSHRLFPYFQRNITLIFSLWHLSQILLRNPERNIFHAVVSLGNHCIRFTKSHTVAFMSRLNQFGEA